MSRKRVSKPHLNSRKTLAAPLAALELRLTQDPLGWEGEGEDGMLSVFTSGILSCGGPVATP
ncbi:MAG: hypothetical protein M5U26_21590 [Planctomycetota bacterium]|nr:hypothetical protein [Planctomycetota bacterium]